MPERMGYSTKKDGLDRNYPWASDTAKKDKKAQDSRITKKRKKKKETTGDGQGKIGRKLKKQLKEENLG